MTEDLVGRLAVKTAGRESNKTVIIVDDLGKNFVLVDGNVKRRRCNLAHLEIKKDKLNIRKGAATEQVLKAMEEAKLEIVKRKPKSVEKKEKPVKKRKVKEKIEKPEKKEEPKEEKEVVEKSGKGKDEKK